MFIHHTRLPNDAWDSISDSQKSYVDEFAFFELSNGNVLAFYANECIAIWKSDGWKQF